MDIRFVRAACAVIEAHKANDCTGAAAAGVVLAGLVMDQAKVDASADTPAAAFRFDIDDEKDA